MDVPQSLALAVLVEHLFAKAIISYFLKEFFFLVRAIFVPLLIILIPSCVAILCYQQFFINGTETVLQDQTLHKII